MANALAELAERIGQVVLTKFSPDYEGDLDVIRKAQRIIAELAKVRVTHYDTACISDCINGYFNCRTIAEEGNNK